jgi:hypothetical protein
MQSGKSYFTWSGLVTKINVTNRQSANDSLSTTENSSASPLTLNPESDKNVGANFVKAEQLNSLEKTLVLFKSTLEQFQFF